MFELEKLRDLYPRSPLFKVAEALRRSPESVQRKARELFQNGSPNAAPKQLGPWDPAEVETLRRGYGAVSIGDLAMILRRSSADAMRQAEALLARREDPALWSDDDEALLREVYGTRADVDLEVVFGRSAQAIRARAAQLCLAKDKRLSAHLSERSSEPLGLAAPESEPTVVIPARMPRWTDGEIEELRELYPRLENLEIASRLGRTVSSVANKAHALGLTKEAGLLGDLGRRSVDRRWRK